MVPKKQEETKHIKQGRCFEKSPKFTVVCLASIFFKFRVTAAGVQMLGTNLILKSYVQRHLLRNMYKWHLKQKFP
jgi:hypothetical protein